VAAHEAEINLGPTDHMARAIAGRVTIYQDLVHIAFDVAGDLSPVAFPFAEAMEETLAKEDLGVLPLE